MRLIAARIPTFVRFTPVNGSIPTFVIMILLSVRFAFVVWTISG
jgi:hypothetical protein